MNNSPEIKIGNRLVGYEHEPLIIAEIGINHGGDLNVAKQMVNAAIANGAEVIKHQTHIVHDEMTKSAKTILPGNADVSIQEIMQRCALNEFDERELMGYVLDKGAIFISTPFSRQAVNRLIKFDTPAFKIGSGECNNYPLLEYICKFGKPIILSTGMNNIASVRKAVNIIQNNSIPYALLHTTNLYPTPPNLVRLGAMTDLQDEFPDAVIGLSDHTTDNFACFGAVALGASILERHFTDSMDREGPDIVCSMDPRALRELINGSRILQQERGGDKQIELEEEQVTRDFAFATVVTTKDIKFGEVLTEENIWVKRPGIGKIPAEDYHLLLGKLAACNLDIDKHISWNDVQ